MSHKALDIHKHLVERIKRNDRNAQREIYELYSVPMFHVSKRILNNSQEAEDVLQEAFLDMFRKIDGFRGESTFGAWFKRIVVNKSINQLKKQRHYTDDIENIEEPEDELDEVEPEYTMEHIKSAMQELSPGFRTVFSLYMFEDYSHKEIAVQMGISEGTSKSQLSRAKSKVKEWLLANKRVS